MGRFRDLLTAALALLDTEAAGDETRDVSARTARTAEDDQHTDGSDAQGVPVVMARMAGSDREAAGGGVFLGGEAADEAVSLSQPGQGG